METKTISHDNLEWINIDEVNDKTIDFLQKNYDFHALDFEDIQEKNITPKIDVYENYLFLVIQYPWWSAQKEEVEYNELHIFLGQNYLITIQQNGGTETEALFQACQGDKKIKQEWMGSSSGFLLYNILENIFQQRRAMLNKIGRKIGEIEDEVFGGEQTTQTIKKIAKYRRSVLKIRRIIDPQRHLVSKLSHIRKPFLGEELQIYFDDINDYMKKIWAVVENYKDTISGLHTTVESLIDKRTGKVLNALTVASVALLPPTLLAGVYGMNINLPFQNRPEVVWWMYGILFLIIVFVIYWFKRENVI